MTVSGSRWNPPLALGILLLATLAGCAGGTATTSEASASATNRQQVLPSTASDPVGAVEGVVVDDENQPLGRAVIGLIELAVQVETGTDGSYAFENVPVGRYRIAASRLGFEGVSRFVTVIAEESVRMDFVLTSLPVTEAVHSSVHRKTLHQASWVLLTWGLNATGPAYNCENCAWTLSPKTKPDLILWEVFGTHTIANPTAPPRDYAWVYNKGNPPGPLLGSKPDAALPIRLELKEDAMEKVDKDLKIWFQLLCTYYWVCVQEARESWITYFYHYEEIPAEFTARP